MPRMQELRRAKIEAYIDVATSRILEIGALDYPTYNRPEHNVKFVDYASTEELAKKGEQNPRYQRDRIVTVDFVCPTPSYAQTIHEQFDLVIANHVIEHVPDTIRWLEELHALLVPGGHLFLSIPDKRYTFDIARPDTTFVDVLRNYQEAVRKPNFYQILEHFYFHKKISASEVWNNTHHDKLSAMRYSASDAVEVARDHAAAPYADVHCHVYTSSSFRALLAPLVELGKIRFEVLLVGEVAPMTNEFHVVLRK